jgi:hypothetical protein
MVFAQIRARTNTPATLGELFMHYTQLSGQKILSVLSDSYNVISAVKKYQASFASDAGLPKDDLARIQLMAANVNVVEKVQTEIRALERELDRQETADKSRY